MTSSQSTPFLSEILSGEPIPPEKLGFFRERFRSRLYETVLAEFIRAQAHGLTKSEVAKRIGRRPEQITRWLGAPGNWTLETVSDLLLAISKAEPEIAVSPLDRAASNYRGQDWIVIGDEKNASRPSTYSIPFHPYQQLYSNE